MQQQVAAVIGSDKMTISKFAMTVAPLWKDSGNRISKMYSGTQMVEKKSKVWVIFEICITVCLFPICVYNVELCYYIHRLIK